MIFIKLAYFAICIVAIVHYYKADKLSPVTLFLMFQLLMFFGICFSGRAATQNTNLLTGFYLIALVCYLFGVAFRNMVRTNAELRYTMWQTRAANGNEQQAVRPTVIRESDYEAWQRKMIWLMIAVSVLACVYFFAAAGRNVFVDAVQNFLAANDDNISKERNEYFSVAGVGYVYQFRAILLPVLTAYIVLATKTKTFWKLVLAAMMLLFLLGTGQRNAFMFYLAIVTIFWLSLETQERQVPKTYMFVFAAIALSALVVLTVANGRVEEEAAGVVSGSLGSLLERIFFVNQRTDLAAFEYIQTQPTVWGYDWAMMLLDILPGKSGYLSVDRIVYHLAYGTYNGTGPPGLWSSAWYNFSWFGITLFPLLMGFWYQSVARWYRRVKKEPLIKLIYAALALLLGVWSYGTPMTLFNNGVVTVALLYWVLYKFPRWIGR